MDKIVCFELFLAVISFPFFFFPVTYFLPNLFICRFIPCSCSSSPLSHDIYQPGYASSGNLLHLLNIVRIYNAVIGIKSFFFFANGTTDVQFNYIYRVVFNSWHCHNADLQKSISRFRFYEHARGDSCKSETLWDDLRKKPWEKTQMDSNLLLTTWYSRVLVQTPDHHSHMWFFLKILPQSWKQTIV